MITLKKKDYSCWNKPCEGCVQVKANSTDYLCTCSKFSSLTCKSEIEQPLGISLALASLNDGNRLASSFDDNSIRITNDSNFQSYSTLNGHNDLINTLFTFTDDILASGSCDSTIKLWNTTSMKLINTLVGHTGCINTLSSFTNFDNTYLISGSNDSTVKVWNQNSIESIYQLDKEHQDSIQAIAYSDRFKYLAV